LTIDARIEPPNPLLFEWLSLPDDALARRAEMPPPAVGPLRPDAEAAVID
jgi:hypothetical protein